MIAVEPTTLFVSLLIAPVQKGLFHLIIMIIIYLQLRECILNNMGGVGGGREFDGGSFFQLLLWVSYVICK